MTPDTTIGRKDALYTRRDALKLIGVAASAGMVGALVGTRAYDALTAPMRSEPGPAQLPQPGPELGFVNFTPEEQRVIEGVLDQTIKRYESPIWDRFFMELASQGATGDRIYGSYSVGSTIGKDDFSRDMGIGFQIEESFGRPDRMSSTVPTVFILIDDSNALGSNPNHKYNTRTVEITLNMDDFGMDTSNSSDDLFKRYFQEPGHAEFSPWRDSGQAEVRFGVADNVIVKEVRGRGENPDLRFEVTYPIPAY